MLISPLHTTMAMVVVIISKIAVVLLFPTRTIAATEVQEIDVHAQIQIDHVVITVIKIINKGVSTV